MEKAFLRRIYRYLFLEPDQLAHRFKKLIARICRYILFYSAWLVAGFWNVRYINLFEKKIYSQQGEDGILEYIFYKTGTSNKYFVEFGVGNGNECNTRLLREMKGWQGLWMDSGKHNNHHIHQEFITAENINDIFRKYNVPRNFDLLSIDIDGNDYWVWKALDTVYAPRVVVIEYNSKYAPSKSKVIEYDPNFKWDCTDYFGASLLAHVKLAEAKGYSLVCCDSKGVNAFFVLSKEAKKYFVLTNIDELYRPSMYGEPIHNFPHSPSSKIMREI